MNSQFLSWWHILCIDTYCGFGYIYVCPRASALIKTEIRCLKAAGPVFFLVQHILALEVSGFACLLRIYKLRQSSRAKRNVCICDRKIEKRKITAVLIKYTASSFENCTNSDWTSISWCVQADIYSPPGAQNKAPTPRTCWQPGGLQSQGQTLAEPYTAQPVPSGVNGRCAILFKKNVFELKVGWPPLTGSLRGLMTYFRVQELLWVQTTHKTLSNQVWEAWPQRKGTHLFFLKGICITCHCF